MKNITLSIPKDLLEKGRAYAKKNGVSLNAMIRELLAQRVGSKHTSLAEFLEGSFEEYKYQTKTFRFDRDELHER